MTKKDLIGEVQERVRDYPRKDVAFAIDIILQAMIDALIRNERIEVRGFGNFTVRSRNSRKGRNPKAGVVIDVPPRKVPFFRAGEKLKRLVNYSKNPEVG